MSNIAELKNVPEISFIDGISLETVTSQMLADYAAAYVEAAGEQPELAQGSPERLLIGAMAVQYYQALQYIDRAGKKGLLKFSEGDYLDNIGALRGIVREPAQRASCKVRFTLSDARTEPVGIPGGTRLSYANLFFATDEYKEIPAGEMSGVVSVTAQEAGIDANGIPVGELKDLVDPVAYVASVSNITMTAGGAEIETDTELTERIYQATAGYSVAGPKDAYIYHAKRARADVDDVVVYSPAPDQVSVLFTLNDGSLPDDGALQAMTAALSADSVRPLTDQVTALAPEEVPYNIALTYYINTADSPQATTIQTAVMAAVENYKSWQRKIGRDVTPSKLIQLVMEAGAKRVAVTAPTHTAVTPYMIAKANKVTVTYGGLEDD